MENIKLGTDGNLQVLGDAEINGGLTANTVSATNIYNKTEVDEKVNKKQDKLTAGSNITITNNVISSIGGTSGDGFVAKTGDTMTGDLNVEANVNIGSGNTFTNRLTTGIYAFAQGIKCTANGIGSHAEGWDTQAIGDGSHAEGMSTQANGDNSHAEGRGTTASGTGSHAEGMSTTASGGTSHAEGLETQTNGIGSHAEGHQTTANGFASHAEGWNTQAIGDTSHAEGQGTTASGDTSHAEGLQTQANGYYSHAEGNSTEANGIVAHAEGYRTISNGYASHAEGYYTIANNDYEHANGINNVSISGTNQDLSALTADTQATLFSIGNGADEQNRKNAFEIKYNGDAYFSGNTKFAKSVSAQTISATTITSPSLDAKQDTLVSGTNIKTINGENLLGSGNIEIQGGGGDGFVAKTGDTMTGDLNVEANVNIGSGNTITGKYAFAQGTDCYAIGKNSHVNGTKTIAGNDNEFVVGRYNVSIKTPLPNANPLFVVGNGTDDTNRYNAFEVWGNGNTHINGDAIVAKGLSAETISATTITSPSLDAKQDTLVSGTNIKTINGENLLGSGNIPVNVDTSGMVAKSGDTMTGDLFIVDSRLWIGGVGNMTSGGICSMVQGTGCVATGDYSSSTGYGLNASNMAEKAVGCFNASTHVSETELARLVNSDATLFSIGNGTDNNNRSSAFEVKWNGDVYIWKNGVAKKLQDLF